MWLFNRVPRVLPKAEGPFVPGCVDVMLDYSKDGVLLRLYYPTNHKKNDKNLSKNWCNWMPDEHYIAGASNAIVKNPYLFQLAFWALKNPIIPCVYGAKPKTAPHPLKCIVFSHGLLANRFLNSTIINDLASRGFLIAVLEHRDGSAPYTYYYASPSDAVTNQRTAINYENFRFGNYAKRNAQVQYRARECNRVLDFLIDINKGVVPENVLKSVPTEESVEFELSDLVGGLDLESVTMAGHSFGGASALQVLSERKEFKQGILLDPWMFPIKDAGLERKIKQPLIFINTNHFHVEASVKVLTKFAESASNREIYTMLYSMHENQTDNIYFTRPILRLAITLLDSDLLVKINNSLILRFLDEKIGGCPTDIADNLKCIEEQQGNIEGLTKPLGPPFSVILSLVKLLPNWLRS